MKILVSACLLGVACRYDGQSKAYSLIDELCHRHQVVPVCPEIMGGLPTPRVPAERRGAQVVTQNGDVTENYQRGAQQVLQLAKKLGCTVAVLKEHSPSCGSGQIYDGTFSATLTEGWGVAAQLLRENGICVLGESQLVDFLAQQQE